ncbi:hypothetical protein CUMW_098020, partial [Citrus unshiu]
ERTIHSLTHAYAAAVAAAKPRPRPSFSNPKLSNAHGYTAAAVTSVQVCCRLYRSCLRLRSPLSAAQVKLVDQ